MTAPPNILPPPIDQRRVPPRAPAPAAPAIPTNQIASAPQANKEPARRGRPILYGIAGFGLGVAFWHAVGFWTFVSEAVFTGPRTQEARAVITPSTQTGTTGSFATGSISPNTPMLQTPSGPNAMSPVRSAAPVHTRPGGKALGNVSGTTTAPRAAGSTGTLNCADLMLDRSNDETAWADCADRNAAATFAASHTAPVSQTAPVPAQRANHWTTGTTAQQPPAVGGWNTAVEPTQ